jgi:hypothetical protein
VGWNPQKRSGTHRSPVHTQLLGNDNVFEVVDGILHTVSATPSYQKTFAAHHVCTNNPHTTVKTVVCGLVYHIWFSDEYAVWRLGVQKDLSPD